MTPNNPTGCTYPPELIEQFADLAKEYGTCLVVDETYRDFIPPSSTSSGNGATTTSSDLGTATRRESSNSDSTTEKAPMKSGTTAAAPPGKPHDLFQRPDWRTHVISVGSFSKSYKIPGHRLGFVVAGQEVMRGLTTVSDCIQVRSCRLFPIIPLMMPVFMITDFWHTTMELITVDMCSSATTDRIIRGSSGATGRLGADFCPVGRTVETVQAGGGACSRLASGRTGRVFQSCQAFFSGPGNKGNGRGGGRMDLVRASEQGSCGTMWRFDPSGGILHAGA